ncbi:hypothetical protein L1987_25430 [Smallanthus sonchifolius]|uniref:Uncharacterized protein n=1 Tax=Smallanthus sonchifolius TaxID=185202 RepID=A0ACB9IPM9_9ASTR|nr:hypothetical protein L1987_25430 [Smallanthus sonchifolius]
MNSKKPILCLSSFSPIRFLFYVIVIFLIIFSINSASCDGGNETDYQALLKIKSMITQPPYGALSSWNNSLHLCEWSGVTCGKRHRRVTSLALDSLGLEGFLSPHVGNLSFLRELSLPNNNFQGVIPSELGRLSRLRFLYLNENKLNGAIPGNISSCSKLEELDLSENRLVGGIPKEISFLSKLIFVSLEDNNLTGGITPFLGNITSMEEFSAVGNSLGGSIPDTLGHWKNLKTFYCSHCKLYGTIPHSLYNLSLLTEISLADNQLTGSLPTAIGTMLPNLVLVQLWGNQLTGPLPPSISNCSRLLGLELLENNFSGKLTIDFAKLRDISFLSLGSNTFGSKEADAMKFIDTLKNCTKLEILDLGYCAFKGLLPRSIGNLSNQLQHLHLGENQLHGNLPISIDNLVGLTSLHVGGNQLTGNIPSTIGKLQKLQVVFLYKNQLSGTIPDAIGNLSSLITLDLFSNMLEGVIPSSMGNCHRLLELYLNDNKLNGRIPTRLLQLSSLSKVLNLSQNNLFGSLPTEVGYLNKLTTLDLSYNNISGNIPSSLGDCVGLSKLSLKANLFQGEVPTLGVFANESAFSVLGNSKLCGGFVDFVLPKCNEIKKHKKKFPLFVIVILIAFTFLAIMCLAYAWCKKSRRQLSQSLMTDRFLKVSYNQLLKATNGFSEANLIGNGGFSSIYKGILDEDNGRFVAVKVLHLQNQGAQRSFMRECEAWRNIRHRNLLRIITSCSSIDFQGNDFKALVYEFMSKGSLHDWLHSSEGTSRLSLLQIANILIDVASALDYIHNHCLPTVVHGDLKPRNILLDDDMVAHVGDFGLARFLGTTSYQNSSTGIRGTIGYAAPEYGLGNEMTSSGDVYSFGILILEVMTKKNPSDDIFNEGFSLHKFASMALPDHVTDIIDVNILNIYQEDENTMQNAMKINECLASTVKIGVSCSMDSPQQRMDIKTVVRELQHIRNTLQNI